MSAKLYIGNRNYSSWSMRPWLALKHGGIAFGGRDLAGVGLGGAPGQGAVLEGVDLRPQLRGQALLEVHTAVQYRLPITFVLFNNNAHAMCVTREQLYYQDLYSYNRFQPSNLGAGLAAMFPGLKSVDVTDLDGLGAAMRAALDIDGPAVVEEPTPGRRTSEEGCEAQLGWPATWADDFSPPLVKGLAEYEGKWVGIPFDVPIMITMYRQDLFDKHNLKVPETVED